MADTSDFKNGMAILFNGKVHTITEFQHVKPGKGPAFVRTVLRNLETGAVVDHKFRAGEKIETVFLERRPMQYLYSSGGTLHFMDMESYEQIELPTEVLGDQMNYLRDNTDCHVVFAEGKLLSVEIPNFMELEITETTGSERGNTAQGATKPAKLETGAVVQVPFHISTGDVIKVDTRTGNYIERVRTG